MSERPEMTVVQEQRIEFSRGATDRRLTSKCLLLQTSRETERRKHKENLKIWFLENRGSAFATAQAENLAI